MCRSRGRPEWPTHTQQLHAITTCRASGAITDLFHGLASKWFEKWIFCITLFFLFFLFTFFAAMLKWSLKLVSCRTDMTNTSLRVYATRHCNHEYRIRFSNFTLQVRKIRNRKVSSRFERLLFVSFHLIEGKAYSPLQAWCPSNFQSSTVDAISSPLPATSNLPPSSANGL